MIEVTPEQDSSNSATIKRIRAEAGNPGTHCPLCTHPVTKPWFHEQSGPRFHVGCVDASHYGVFVAPKAHTEHYYRPIARELRHSQLASLLSYR